MPPSVRPKSDSSPSARPGGAPAFSRGVQVVRELGRGDTGVLVAVWAIAGDPVPAELDEVAARYFAMFPPTTKA